MGSSSDEELFDAVTETVERRSEDQEAIAFALVDVTPILAGLHVGSDEDAQSGDADADSEELGPVVASLAENKRDCHGDGGGPSAEEEAREKIGVLESCFGGGHNTD